VTTVLLAVDESAHAEHAARAAHRLFGDAATYVAVHVGGIATPPMAAAPGIGNALGAAPVMWHQVVVPPEEDQALAEATARAAAADAGLADAEVVGALGDPGAAILRVAAEHHVDVIVVGVHHRAWWERLLEPSVAHEVLRDAKVPVLVVPSP
jgi:nucleotide-binding universal stress UspA family protein